MCFIRDAFPDLELIKLRILQDVCYFKIISHAIFGIVKEI